MKVSFKELAKLIAPLKTDYTVNADGWHPNINGYAKYYADKIASFLERL